MSLSEKFIERAFSEEELKEVVKNNKYFNFNKDLDPIDILNNGISKINSQGEMFRHVMTVAMFVKERDNFDGISSQLLNFLTNLDDAMLILFAQQQGRSFFNAIESEMFYNVRGRIVNIGINNLDDYEK